MTAEVQEYSPDIPATEEALVTLRESRREVAKHALENQQKDEARRDAARQAVDKLGGVYTAINEQCKVLRDKITTERAAAVDQAVEALAEGKKFDFGVVAQPALAADLEGLMVVLSDVAEIRLPAARRALALAEIEVSESTGITLMRIADMRAAETARLSLAVSEFEGSRVVSSTFAEDGHTATLRRQARNLIEAADEQKRALDRVTMDREREKR